MPTASDWVTVLTAALRPLSPAERARAVSYMAFEDRRVIPTALHRLEREEAAHA